MLHFLDRFGDFLLAKAMESEQQRASLYTRHRDLSIGPMAFYTNRPDASTYPEAVILLHGASADKTTWLRCARNLQCQPALIVPDLPGHGHSTGRVDLDYSIAAQVKYLAEFMQALSISRAHIIGNSMGGAVALGLAAAAPHQVASLVLISAAGAGTYDPKLMEHVARMGRNPLVTIENEADFKNMLRFGMVKPPYIPGLLRSALTRARIAHNRINEKVAADIGRDMDQSDKLAQITVPSLIIWGDQDQVLPLQNATLLAQGLVNSKKVVLSGIGHVPMVEAPKQVAALCSEFLASRARPLVAYARHE